MCDTVFLKVSILFQFQSYLLKVKNENKVTLNQQLSDSISQRNQLCPVLNISYHIVLV